MCFREWHLCRAKTASRGEVCAAAASIGFGVELNFDKDWRLEMSASNFVSHRFGASHDVLQGKATSAAEAERTTLSLTMQLYGIGYFLRTLGIQLRFGHLSRAPLKLLRLELRGDAVECDWIARPADPWDANLPHPVGNRHASAQALEDAIAVRDLIFGALPGVNSAVLRVYRRSANTGPDLIIEGAVARNQSAARSIRSLAMRAKLCGLRFWLEDGILEALRTEECAMSF
jgi:hypothetical protein